MAKILSIETSCGKCSVAISQTLESQVSILKYLESEEPNNQSKNLFDLISKLDVDLKEIDYIACSIGPGSFTGVRVGISAAVGLSVATNIKIIGVSTLEALSYVSKTGCIIVDAGSTEFYAQNFRNSIACSDVECLVKDDLLKFAGDFEIIDNKSELNAKLVAYIATDKINEATYDISPLYVKEPNARFNK